MKILVDTSGYEAFRRENPHVVRRISNAETVLLSPIVLGELLYGFRRGSRYDYNMSLLARFLDHEAVEIIPVGAVTAERYARIGLDLARGGSPIPSNDVWIAAQAMEHGAELVTSDRHFERIPGLVCTIF